MGEGRAEQAGAAKPSSTDDADVLASPHPDWLYHHLLVTGDAELVMLFRQAAAWRDDLGHHE